MKVKMPDRNNFLPFTLEKIKKCASVKFGESVWKQGLLFIIGGSWRAIVIGNSKLAILCFIENVFYNPAILLFIIYSWDSFLVLKVEMGKGVHHELSF